MFGLVLLFCIGWSQIGSRVQAGEERIQLYTEPNPESSGGIAGRITKPDKKIEQILAIPQDAPEKVYQGEITGEDGRSFRFEGLPMRKYDLIVIYPNEFHEGLRLHRGDSTLTEEDTRKIDAIIQKSEPFFNQKFVHRLKGETGRGNHAQCICTFLRSKKSDLKFEQFEGKWSRDDYRRTFKLMILKDVGPGWQVVRARDLYPVWTKPDRATPKHHFSVSLSNIRVAGKIKEIELNLEPETGP